MSSHEPILHARMVPRPRPAAEAKPLIPVRLDGRILEVAAGTPVGRVVDATPSGQVIGATLNRHLVGLDTPLFHAVVVHPVPRTDLAGSEILRRTAAAMLHALVGEHYPSLRFLVGQSVLEGYYYEIRPPLPALADLEALALDLTHRLRELVARDEPIHRHAIPIEEAPAVLTDPDGNKVRLLQTWPSPQVPIVQLRGFTDVQHGPYAPSTGYARGARVVPYPPGLILQFSEDAPQPEWSVCQPLLDAFHEARQWNGRAGVATVGDLNAATLGERMDEVIRVQEALHEKRIARLADEIAHRREDLRLVCIAGPSSSGKSTFVRRLSVQLRVNGLEPLALALDDYYRNRADCPRGEDGAPDYEGLAALDTELLARHLAALVAGGEVSPPRFDFIRGERLPPGRPPMRLRPDQVVLMEGMHALNPALTDRIDPEAKFRIFVSCLTPLTIDEHNRIATSDARLLRRLVRDRRYRACSAAETIAMWPRVRRGEERHIFPYQGQCDVMFNSALAYETAVLKTFAWRYLLEVPRDHPARTRAYSLLKFLELFVPVFPDTVPSNSVLREFIGGTGFTY